MRMLSFHVIHARHPRPRFSNPSSFLPASVPYHSPYTLPSSVSCKSFACRSYEHRRGVYQQFPTWSESLGALDYPPKSLPHNSFADPHPVTPLESYLFKNRGEGPQFRTSPLMTPHWTEPLDRKGRALLTNRLLARGGSLHGFIHIGVGLLAGVALALVAALEVFKIILEDFRASLAHAFSGSLIQRGFGLLLGRAIRMPRELHDRGVGAQIALILRVAVPLHLLVQRVNEQVVGPQDKHNPRDSQNREPLKQDAEPAPSPKFILADYSAAQPPQQRRGVHEYLHCAGMRAPQPGRWAAGADNGLTIYWTSCQFPGTEPGCNLLLSQSKVRP